jgi:threonyl-tRNA synthetase
MENRAVSVRARKDGDMGSMDLAKFIEKIKEEIDLRK